MISNQVQKEEGAELNQGPRLKTVQGPMTGKRRGLAALGKAPPPPQGCAAPSCSPSAPCPPGPAQDPPPQEGAGGRALFAKTPTGQS